MTDVCDAAELVDGIRSSPGWAVLQRIIDAEISQIEAGMENTSPLTRAEYAMRHGRIGGLRAMQVASDAIIAIAAKRLADEETRREGGADASPER